MYIKLINLHKKINNIYIFILIFNSNLLIYNNNNIQLPNLNQFSHKYSFGDSG